MSIRQLAHDYIITLATFSILLRYVLDLLLLPYCHPQFTQMSDTEVGFFTFV